jgi:hypothetical protein
LADPHILLPSSADLTRAFIKDLGNVLDVTVGGGATTSVMLFTGGGTQQVWTSPKDLTIVLVVPVSGSAQVCLSTDSSSYTTNFSAAGNFKFGSIIYLGGTTTSQSPIEMSWPVLALQKLYFTNNSASNAGMLLYFS